MEGRNRGKTDSYFLANNPRSQNKNVVKPLMKSEVLLGRRGRPGAVAIALELIRAVVTVFRPSVEHKH